MKLAFLAMTAFGFVAAPQVASADRVASALAEACAFIEGRVQRPPEYGLSGGEHFLAPVAEACREIEKRDWIEPNADGELGTEGRVSAWFALNCRRAIQGLEGRGRVNDAALLLALQHREVFETAGSVIFLAELADSQD